VITDSRKWANAMADPGNKQSLSQCHASFAKRIPSSLQQATGTYALAVTTSPQASRCGASSIGAPAMTHGRWALGPPLGK